MTEAAAETDDRSANAAAEAGFERLEVADRFLLLSGWVAAPPPHRLAIGDAAAALEGVFPRPDLAQEDGPEPYGFVVDLPRPEGDAEALGISLRSGARRLLGSTLGALPRASFQPRGHLDHVSPERLAGWVFNPTLWHGPVEAGLVELVIDGEHRVPLALNCKRPDLPFSAALAGRVLGFEIGLREVAALMARARVRRELLGGEHDYVLQTGGIPVGGLRRSRGRVILRGRTAAADPAPAAEAPPPLAAAPAPTPAATPAPAAASGEPAGYVDYFGALPALGGWVFGGWVRGETLAGLGECPALAQFEALAITDRALVARHPRPDVAGLGQGFVGFLPAEDDTPLGTLQRLCFGAAGEHPLQISLGARQPDPAELIGMVRGLLGVAPGAAQPPGQAPLLKLLCRPVYEGVETLSRLAVPVHLEVDSVLVAPGAGLVLIGWALDPTKAVTSVRLRCGSRASAPLARRWVATERADIREAFSGRFTLDHGRWGYVCFVETPTEDLAGAHLELELADGGLAFRPLPPAAEGGVGAIRRLLNGLELPADQIQRLCDEVLGPPVVAINRARLAACGPAVEVEVGVPLAAPRCSLIIPLYGRIDYLMYQCALFSEYGLPADELIYVLDDPPRRGELIELARSAYRRFGIPLRLVLLSENRGYAPANNAGLAIARGEYICFLNSDVMPRDGVWLDRLCGRLAEDATLGIMAPLLLFEDGTVQHDGMAFERLPQFGNWPFALHPGKGRIRGAPRGLHEEPAVTGACMVLRRDLAQQLGGFDTDYVVGDFEDADLCFRIRAMGLRCAVDDGAVLWHLERQSQGAPGNNWRMNLTLVNAWTFARRWNAMVPDAAPAAAPGSVLRLS